MKLQLLRHKFAKIAYAAVSRNRPDNTFIRL